MRRQAIVALAVALATCSRVAAADSLEATARDLATPNAPAAAWEKDSPISLSLNYVLVSDYIWRGINFSEYPGEGKEDLNHQITSTFSIATPIGTVGATGWFEWFQGQENINPAATNHLQEIDYTLFWNYTLASIGTTVEFGWTSYTFPHTAGEAFATYEFYGKVSLDDSVLFGFPVIKPFAFWAIDYDQGEDGSWILIGGSHDFKGADAESFASVPFVKDLTVTPSLSVAFDWRYLNYFALAGTDGPHRKVSAINYGLAVTYDLSSAVAIPKRYGGVTVGGFLVYSQAVERTLLNDELYGGASIAYNW